jgi:TrmH family RNA methyltransferase
MSIGELLANVSIVLVDTKTPANIGAVARCMMNTGLSRLILVRPPEDRLAEAVKLAAGAEPVLNGAVRSGTLREAVADHHLVIGTSRRLARSRRNVRPPRDMAEQVLPLLAKNRVAVVFGREVNGLDRDDLSLCHELIAIPSSDDFPSLNLSHAVMVVAYELFLAAHAGGRTADRALAPSGEVERFFGQLELLLRDAGFIDGTNAERMMFSLRQIFGRARLEPRDVSILRGILTALADRSRPEDT